jgi:drug/metabolite transporter (DMT)-like permease
MSYFIIAILLGAAIYLLFKYVGAKQLHLPTVVLFNYIVCVVIGFAGLVNKSSVVVVHPTIIGSSAIMGLLFISMFYLMGMLTNQAGVAVSSIISRISMVIPTLFFFLAWGEELSLWAIIGVFTAIAAIIMVNNKKGQKFSFKNVLPLIVFIGYGLVDVGLKLSQNAVKELDNVHHELTLGIFFFAGLYGWLIKFAKGIKLKTNAIAPGILLGAVNYFSIYFFFLALENLNLPNTVIFPINGISIMLIATVLSVFLFREAFTAKKIVAMILAVISIVLLSN